MAGTPLRDWFDALEPTAAAKVTVALARREQGNFSNAKGVGEAVMEYRIDFGPRYRVYFGREGDALVILLGDQVDGLQASQATALTTLWH